LPIVCESPGNIGGTRSQWTGPADCSFRFAVRHDARSLYVAVRTRDDAVFCDPAKKPWKQDSVAIRLDARPAAERARHRRKAQKDFLSLNVAPGKAAGEVHCLEAKDMPKGVRMACTRLADGLAVELAVPVAYLDKMQGGTWKDFQLQVGAHDSDAATDGFLRLLWVPKGRFGAAPTLGVFRRQD
jgi:hypothetical protein